MYTIRFAKGVKNDLDKISIYYLKQILAAVSKQLATTPKSPTRNRNLLANLIPPWEAVPSIWELRAGEHRVFYDVSQGESIVYVRAIRRKRRRTKTEEIL